MNPYDRLNESIKELIKEWHDNFRISGEIPIPEDVTNLDWIEDCHIFLIDWITKIYIENNLIEKHLKALESILLEINSKEYKYISKIINSEIKKINYAKNYRIVNKEEIKKKRAKYYLMKKDNILCKKILDNLNTGITVKPRKTTMDKYNIYHDGEKWIVS